MKFDHIAIESLDIDESVKWYKKLLDNSRTLYQDKTWALVESKGVKFAFVTPGQHPRHIAVRVETEEQLALLEMAHPKLKWKTHRDGTSSFYAQDPSGNFVEFIKYPEVKIVLMKS